MIFRKFFNVTGNWLCTMLVKIANFKTPYSHVPQATLEVPWDTTANSQRCCRIAYILREIQLYSTSVGCYKNYQLKVVHIFKSSLCSIPLGMSYLCNTELSTVAMIKKYLCKQCGAGNQGGSIQSNSKDQWNRAMQCLISALLLSHQ